MDYREIGGICSNGGISFNNVTFDILLCLQRTYTVSIFDCL